MPPVNPIHPLRTANQNAQPQPNVPVLSSPFQVRKAGHNAERRVTINAARGINGNKGDERTSHDRERDNGGERNWRQPEELRPLSQLFSHPGNHEILGHVMRLLPRQDLFALRQVCRNTAWVIKNDAASQVRLERHRYRIPTPPEGSTDVSLIQWQQDFASRSRQRLRLIGEADKTRLGPGSNSTMITVQGGLAVAIDRHRVNTRADHWALTTLPDRPLMGETPPRMIAAPTVFDQLLVCAPDDAVFTVTMARFLGTEATVIEVHPFLLRRPDTGPATVHPEARFSIVASMVPVISEHDPRNVIRVRCAPGGLLAVLCPAELSVTGRQRLYVIDWKKGVCLGIYYPHTALTRYRSILFIGKNRLLCGGVRMTFGETNRYQPVLDVLDCSLADSFGLIPRADRPNIGRIAPPGQCATLRMCASFTLPKTRSDYGLRETPRGISFGTASELLHDAQDDVSCARSLQLSGSTLHEARVATFFIGHGCSGVVLLSGLLDLIDEHESHHDVEARSSLSSPTQSIQDAEVNGRSERSKMNGSSYRRRLPIIEWDEWRHYAYLGHERDTIVPNQLASGSRVCALASSRRDGVFRWRLEVREFNTRVHELLLNQPDSTWTAGIAPRQPDELGEHKPAGLIYVRNVLVDGSSLDAAESASTMPFPLCWDNGHILIKEVDIQTHVEPRPEQELNFNVLHITNEPPPTIDDDAMSSIAALMGDVPYEAESA